MRVRIGVLEHSYRPWLGAPRPGRCDVSSRRLARSQAATGCSPGIGTVSSCGT